MKILVLGGTGAMGKPVVKILGARGHRVDVTTRKARNDEGDNIHYVVGNAHDMAFLENILKENMIRFSILWSTNRKNLEIGI